MSVVTNIILTARSIPWDRHALIESATDGYRGGLRKVNDHAGGDKCWEADTWMAAINHLDEDALMAALAEAIGPRSDNVLLVIHHEYDEEPGSPSRVFALPRRSGQWQQIHPSPKEPT